MLFNYHMYVFPLITSYRVFISPGFDLVFCNANVFCGATGNGS